MAGQAPRGDVQHGEGPDGTTCPRGHLTTSDTASGGWTILPQSWALGWPGAQALGLRVAQQGVGWGGEGWRNTLSPSRSPQHPRSEARGPLETPEAAGRGARLPSGLGLPQRFAGGVWGQPWSWSRLAVHRSWGASL